MILLLAGSPLLAAKLSSRTFVADSLFYSISLSADNTSPLRQALRSVRRPASVAASLDSLGFFHAVWDTSGDTIHVTPGRRTRIDTLVVRCECALTTDSLSWSGPIPYDAGAVQDLAREATLFLATRGHPYATLDVDVIAPPETGSSTQPHPPLTIMFSIAQGRTAVYGTPMFEGTSVTSRKTLLHDVTFKPGDPFDIRAVRETIARLQMQPYIASASAGTPAVRQQPFASASVRSDSVDTVIVPLRIQERSGLGLEGVMGFRSDANPENRLFGQVDVTLLNVFGSGESATFDYRGDQTRNSLGIDITKPHLLGYPITAEAGFALEIAREQYGFLEGTIGLLSRLSTYWHGGLVLRASEATDQGVDSTGALTFYGLDFVLRRSSYPGSRGVRSWSLETNMGTGTALRDAGRFTRWRIDTRASIHQPLFKRQALSLTGVGRTIITDEQDRLQPVERFRAGGHESIRGYAENEFSFQTLAYGQCEYLFYLAALGALYAFVDGGAGFTEMVDFSASSRTDLLGYGLGMRIPSRFGTLSLEWARSRVDRSNLGRIHIRFRNSLVRENNR